MARKVEYTIHGRDRSKRATRSAQNNLKALSSAAKLAATTMKVAFAAVGIRLLVNGIDNLLDKFGEQEDAVLRLTAAAINNPLINGEAVENLKNYASALQNVSIYGDETLIQQAAFLTTLQLSETQIKDVLAASVDLASTGIISLESAVKNLARTYSGTSGELGRLIPALRDLTKEELEAGRAVEIISEYYAGMAEAAASGVNGARIQIKNLIGDLQEEISETLAPAFKVALEKIKPIILDLIGWFDKHSDKIINFFLFFPEIAKLAFNTILSLAKDRFGKDRLKNILFAKLDWWLIGFITDWQAFASTIKMIAGFIFLPFDLAFQWLVYGVKSLWSKMVDFLVNTFNSIISPVQTIINGLLDGINLIIRGINLINPFKDIKEIGDIELNVISSQGSQLTKPTDTFSSGTDDILGKFYRDKAVRDAKIEEKRLAGLEAYAGRQEEIFTDFVNDFDAIVNRDFKSTVDRMAETADKNTETANQWKSYVESIDLVKPFEEYIKAINKAEREAKGFYPPTGAINFDRGTVGSTSGPSAYKIPNNLPASGYVSDSVTITEQALNSFTETLSLGADGVTSALGDMLGGLSSAVGPILQMAIAIGSALLSIKNFSKVFNFFGTIMGKVVSVIAPVVNSVLAPLVGWLEVFGIVIGKMLNPIFEALSPIIILLTDVFVFLHNFAIRPVVNIFIFLVKIVAGVIDVLAALAGVFLAPFLWVGDKLVWIMESAWVKIQRFFKPWKDFDDPTAVDSFASYMQAASDNIDRALRDMETSINNQGDYVDKLVNNQGVLSYETDQTDQTDQTDKAPDTTSFGGGASYTGAATQNFYITYTIGQLAGDDGIDKLLIDNRDRLAELIALGY